MTNPNIMKNAQVDNTYVHPRARDININRYNKQEKTE